MNSHQFVLLSYHKLSEESLNTGIRIVRIKSFNGLDENFRLSYFERANQLASRGEFSCRFMHFHILSYTPTFRSNVSKNRKEMCNLKCVNHRLVPTVSL